MKAKEALTGGNARCLTLKHFGEPVDVAGILGMTKIAVAHAIEHKLPIAVIRDNRY
tara:strand:- start:559 stop:726 length:168 start_codon:yes stop_codon:yes gene_type:complete